MSSLSLNDATLASPVSQQPMVPPGMMLAAFSTQQGMSTVSELIRLNSSLVAEIERIANEQNQQSQIQSQRFSTIEAKVIELQGRLHECEQLREAEKGIADQSEALHQTQMTEANQKLEDQKEESRTVVAAAVAKNVEALQQVADLRTQLLQAEQNAQIKVEEANFANQQLAQARAQNVLDVQSIQERLNAASEQIAQLQNRKNDLDHNAVILLAKNSDLDQQIIQLRAKSLADLQLKDQELAGVQAQKLSVEGNLSAQVQATNQFYNQAVQQGQTISALEQQLQAQVQATYALNNALTPQIEALTAQNQSQAGTIQSQAGSINSLNHSIAALTAQKAAAENKVQTLRQAINTVNQMVESTCKPGTVSVSTSFPRWIQKELNAAIQ